MFLGGWGGGSELWKLFRIGVCWLTSLTVIACSNIICECCSYSPFILKYPQEKVIRKQVLAWSPHCHANGLCSPVVSSRKCGNIIFPARQQSNWLCSAFFFFFSIMACINFPFTWFAISFSTDCKREKKNKLWAFTTVRLHWDQIYKYNEMPLGCAAIEVIFHFLYRATPNVWHQVFSTRGKRNAQALDDASFPARFSSE